MYRDNFQSPNPMQIMCKSHVIMQKKKMFDSSLRTNMNNHIFFSKNFNLLNETWSLAIYC
jgi:hypothetical protein